MNLSDYIRDIEGFPKPGILFKDITPLLKSPEALDETLKQMENALKGVDFDYVIGVEARGFMFATALAARMGKGMIPVRKPGKLPASTYRKDYDLEYGSAGLEIHKDAFEKGDRLIIVDDILATGGTVEAVVDMVKEMGGEVKKVLFLAELEFLNGREKLAGESVDALVKY
ncbi:MAG TPA: adenine phosphoribosyltransferase [Thermotogota bacterium]|nr:adenine phosphoribosyltransferase [Thermotogota bacterium]HPR95808.1 adenine phosphoribosyltransferase [Thermotogota bacterium]